MAAPVWVLSVDLQTKTATFQSGMADAARAARKAFSDIKSSAHEGGEAVSRSSINAQQALGVLTNALRGDVEGAFADIVREMSHTSVVMAALPFAAAAGGALLLVGVVGEIITKVKEWREAQEKLKLTQAQFGTTVQETYNALDDRILQSGQRTDELRNNHLAALQKQLELINHQSMQDLVKEFESISRAAESTFKLLEGHWYTFGIGSAGASHALEQFKTQYDSLLAQGKDGEATNLLTGTLKTAKDILAAQQQAKANTLVFTSTPADTQRVTNAFQEAYVKLKAAGVSYTQKEIDAQKALIQALEAQQGVEKRISELKGIDSSNAKTSVANDDSAQRSAAARAAAQNQASIAEQQLAGEKAIADARLTIQAASIEQRLQSDIAFAVRDRDIKLQANAAEIAALDKASKDYNNNLKALRDQQLSIEAQYQSSVSQLRSKADVAQYQKDLADLQQAEREKINATQQGSAERLAEIDRAMKEAQAKNLEDTDYYRQLRTMRVDTERQGAEQETQAKLQGIQTQEKADEQSLQSQARIQQQQLAARDASIQEQTALALSSEENIYALQRAGLQKQLETLRESGVSKKAEVERVQQQIEALAQEHETRKTEIQKSGDIARAAEFNRAMVTMESRAAASIMSMLSGQRSFVSVMGGLASQLTQNLIQAAIAHANVQRSEQLTSARAAAASTWEKVSQWPVVGPILAPVMAATAFAGVMAFNQGTDSVPGIGNRDTVPAMLTPGEGVVPGGVMDGLRKVANNGGFEGSKQPPVLHVSPTYNIQALDNKGVQRTLRNNTSTLTKHFRNEVRKLNK